MLFAPEIALAIESSATWLARQFSWLSINIFMHIGKCKCNVSGWQTHWWTYAVAHSFLQQASLSREWFLSRGKDPDQRNLALFENPTWQCNGARQLSPEHIVTDAYDCSWNGPQWSVKASLLFWPHDSPGRQSTFFMRKGKYTRGLVRGLFALLLVIAIPNVRHPKN